jgi:hypothetical protein
VQVYTVAADLIRAVSIPQRLAAAVLTLAAEASIPELLVVASTTECQAAESTRVQKECGNQPGYGQYHLR